MVAGEQRLVGHEAILTYVRANFATLSGFRFERWQTIGIGDLAVVNNDTVFWEGDAEQESTTAHQLIVLNRDDGGCAG